MPRRPTYPISSLAFLNGWNSLVRFHCQLLARFVFSCTLWVAVPPKEESNMLVPAVNGPSSGRSAPVPTVNGGLAPTSRVLVPLIGSRAKNCPMPERSTHFALPHTSQAKPKRGAIRWLFEGTILRFLE